jgi:hypothetical protein
VLENNLKNTQGLAVKALDKENRLEEMLFKEEEEREKEQMKELAIQIESEKKKGECLQKTIEEKKKEEQFNVARVKIQDQIEKVKAQTQSQIQLKRQSIKTQIENMRRRAKLKMKSMEDQLLTIRTTTLDNYKKAVRTGSSDECYIPKENDPKQLAYCNKYFIGVISPTDNANCMDRSNYCEMCCLNEFTETHLVDREKCIKEKCEVAEGVAVAAVPCDQTKTVTADPPKQEEAPIPPTV